MPSSLDLGTLSSSGQSYTLTGSHLSSLARISSDGRLVVDLNLLHDRRLPELPGGYAQDVKEPDVEPEPPAVMAGDEKHAGSSSRWEGRVPKLNVLILIVGSRGDVQPYVALSLALVAFGHRVRLATHPDFRDFVHTAGQGKLEFHDIGGNPKELLAWMVANPGLLPSFESLSNGDVGRKKKQLAEIMEGCFRATHEPDERTGRAFAPDAMLANSPAFAAIHLAEALGRLTNVLSYALSENFTWLGLSDMTNTFRTKTLGLAPLSFRSGPSLLDRLKVPWTYAWSPSLLPKPSDWRNQIDIAGFYFLNLAEGYEPPAELAAFLSKEDDRPLIYIGFGSVPVSDPAGMSLAIRSAIQKADVRALISVGWAGLSSSSGDGDAAALEKADDVFLLQDVPHDWLFAREQVKACVHHGGAGTTAIGFLNGLPSVIVPWFGDQKSWGLAAENAGVGPAPIPGRELTANKLAEGIKFALSPRAKAAAQKLGEQIRAEDGVQAGLDSFHRHLPLQVMRCEVDPSLVAVWWSDALCLRLSALAAAVLSDAHKLKLSELEPHRPKEYDTRKQATDPITGGASEILRTVANYYMGIGQLFINPPKGVINTATAIPKGVLNIVQSIHEGFHNLPKAYGSDVRAPAKVTGFKSGLQEGMKGLATGYYDGISGLVTEPLAGGKKEGFLGAIKGAGRSYINATMKPAAGIVGLVAHPADGAWKSVQSLWARKDASVVRDTRLSDGTGALASCSPATRKRIIAHFAELEKGTMVRRAALERRARAVVEGEVRKAEEVAKDAAEEGGSGRETPRLTLADDVSTADEDEDVTRTPDDREDRRGRIRVSVEEEDILRRLAEAEQKGYERAKREKAQASSE